MPTSSNPFIQNTTSSIPASQRAAVNSIIEERRLQGEFLNRTSLRSAVANLNRRLKSNGRAFLFNKVRAGQRVSSDYLNQLFEDIKVDLDVLYSQIAVISSDNARIKSLVDDNFITTRANINELINQLRLYRFLKLNPDFQDAKMVSFANATNRTSGIPKAYVDPTTRQMKLPLSRGNKLGTARFNLDRVTATTKHHGGGISGRDEVNFGVDRSLDDNPETFYGDIVLCEGQPYHKLWLSHSSEDRLLGSGRQSGHTYVSSGIVLDIQYNFSKTVSSNQLRLLPIADYPVRIIDIAYKTSDGDSDWTTVPDFDPLSYEETLDWLEWNGRRFYMSQLRILIEQQNYTNNIYHIPSQLLKNNQLWSQILDSSYQEAIHNIELDAIVADKIAANPESLLYLNELNDLGVTLSNTTLRGEELKDYELAERLQRVVADHMARTEPGLAGELFSQSDTSTKLSEVRRLQFVAGLRVIEVNDNTYQPFAFYESQKFVSNANLLEIELQTTEEHQKVPDSVLGRDYSQTSTEWEIELGNSIHFPIAPVQYRIETDGGVMVDIKDEVLILNRKTATAITRFPIAELDLGSYNSVQIRKNGIRLSPTVPNSGLGGQALQNNYTVQKQANSHLLITFNSLYFDQRAVYTISYMAHENAAVIDINDRLDSHPTTDPEIFTGTDKNNLVKLRHFPYVEYEIVNDEILWRQDANDVPRWRFVPAIANYSIGSAGVDVTDLTVITGLNTFWNASVQELVTGNINGLTGAAIQFVGDNRIYSISGVTSDSGLVTYDPVETGFIPTSGVTTGLPYVIGKVQHVDGITYGLSEVFYQPIEVYVDDILASNKTDYNTLEHNAFVPQNSASRIFEYIQAGNSIYFNAPINGKIEVSYRYLTEYLKVNSVLRSHKPVNPNVTPVITDYQVHIKNSKV